ncbi:hypothetical protein QYE76_012424 [Lolium multiflorum]|uniref:Gag-pol polyprotein n=1 Tax=Lolium multiflorum TaxID=4521 RepID=A0AAD8U0Z4_LOLMU|nr:hypothetical protein QYE76_012424 [Lolium multiflorum]
MATSSSTSTEINLGSPPTELLTRSNFSLWRAQVLPEIRGAELTGLLDGTDIAPPKLLEAANPEKDKEPIMVPNPQYKAWLSRDQKVLGYLLKSLSKEVLMHVLRMEHATDVWKAVEQMFVSQSVSKVTNLRIALANTKKHNLSTPAFFAKMQGFADEMAAAGKPLPDDELLLNYSRTYSPSNNAKRCLLPAMMEGSSPPLMQQLEHATAVVVVATDRAPMVAEKIGTMMINVMMTDVEKGVKMIGAEMIGIKMIVPASIIKGAVVVDEHLLVVAVAVDVVAAALRRGLMSLAKYVTERVIPPRIVGIAFRIMMMTMKLMHMGLTQIGTLTLEPRIISLVN